MIDKWWNVCCKKSCALVKFSISTLFGLFIIIMLPVWWLMQILLLTWEIVIVMTPKWGLWLILSTLIVHYLLIIIVIHVWGFGLILSLLFEHYMTLPLLWCMIKGFGLILVMSQWLFIAVVPYDDLYYDLLRF